MKLKILSQIVIVTLFFGCSAKDELEYNKPALYWYQQMVKQIGYHNLDKADNYFTSLQSEHVASPFLPEAMLMLAHAHIKDGENILGLYYLDEYARRYGDKTNQDYIDFLKIRSKFLTFEQPNRNQSLIDEALIDIKKFAIKHPNSDYRLIVDSMLTQFLMAQKLFNEEIVSLYDRLEKPKAVAIYKEKNSDNRIKIEDLEPPHVMWLRKIFE